MKNLSKENLSKLPSKTPDIKPKITFQQQPEKDIRKSEGFTTFNLTSKNDTHGPDKGFNKKLGKNEVINNSTIQYISNSEPIEVLPSEIIFKDIQTNQTYEITVYVRNLTKKSRRIRVYQPQTAKFRADYDMQGAIAAGIAMKLIVTFETSVLDKNGFHDVMKIVSDDNYERDVPLHAYPQQASIIFEPFINFGFVKMNGAKTEKVYFKNEGKIQTKVTLKMVENQDLVIDPATFSIQANSEYAVNLTYSPKDAGIFRGLIDVETDAQTLLKQIDVNATSVEFAKFIIDENGSKVDQQDFGTFYYGQTKKIQCYLVNNTPKKYRFNSRFRDGLIYGSGDMATLQTPVEVGKEQTEKIMSCEPAEGIIDCYSQIPIILKCQAQVSYKQQIQCQNYAISKEEEGNVDHDDYSYSAIFEFNGEKEDNVIIHVTGHGVCPQVKLAPQNYLEFGDCSVNDHKDIMFQITNKNKEIPIDVFLPRIPYFHVKPNTAIIEANSTAHFIASFQPKQIENLQGNLNINLVNNSYQVAVKFQGRARDLVTKGTLKRGTECLPEDFEHEKNFVTEENMYKQKKKDDSLVGKSQQWLAETDAQFIRSYDKKQQANEYLKNERQKRVKKDKEQIIKQKFEQMSERMRSLGKKYFNKYSIGIPTHNEEVKDDSEDDAGAIKSAPRDYEFEVGMVNRRLDSPKLQIPESKDNLFVMKPIGKNEPLKGEDNVAVITFSYNLSKIIKFDPNPDQYVKKKFPQEPKNHAEVRDIQAALSGDELQQIMAGPIYIDFGSVYVKSTQRKTFFIRNDLRTAIQAQLYIGSDELSQSYLKPQIIPSSQTAGFDVVICSSSLHNIKQNIKYIINGKHSFEFQILAKIELVKLDMSTKSNQIKMAFTDDNIDMCSKEVIRVTNNGSKITLFKNLIYLDGPAKFKFQHTQAKIFSFSPEEGEVAAHGFMDLTLTYTPPAASGYITEKTQMQGPQGQVIRPQEEEKITMRVVDGNDTVLKISGQVPEPRVIIKSGGNLDFKEITVCRPEQKDFQIKNNSRVPAIFQVDLTKLPENTEVSPVKGKLGPDEYRNITVKFFSKEEKTVKGEIRVLVRGGKTILIPFYAKTIIPQIDILEEQLDFGNITTLSNASQLKMTLVNNSQIPAEMILDLRGEDENPDAAEGVDCLEVILDQDNEESILHSVHPDNDDVTEKQEQKPQNEEDLENDALNESEQSVDENVEQRKSKLFNFVIHPAQQLVFTVKFSPKETRHYRFLMPITLSRYGHLDTMQRFVICKGLNPKFLIEPQICEFKRKIITTPDKCIATNSEIMLSNPDRKPMKWWLDMTQLNIDKIFQITPSEGIVQPGLTETIKASFNPFAPQRYEKSVPLYIDDPEISSTQPYMDIQLKGEGQFPRLLFDRKEIILPVVPLNIEATCLFRIINDGYENLNLKYKIIQDISNINVDLRFLEGKNLGITKNRLKIQAFFKTPKSLSFTTRIEFYDDSGRIYTLPISGTSDNCLLTNYAYFQRCKGEFKITIDDDKKGPVILIEDEAGDDVNSIDGNSEGKVASKKKGTTSVVSNKTLSSHGSSKSTRSALGYSPIPTKDLEYSCEFIKRWMSFNVLTQSIQQFPATVIENNGSELFELITYLTGKVIFPYKVIFDGTTKRVDKCQKLYKQYDDMIKQLKTEGGLLNHIRPEFLLGYNDYCAYIKQLPRNITDHMTQSAQKLPLQRFTYISIDAWIVIFYQIIKIYYLSRINSKTFKSIPGIPPERTQIPTYVDGSNIYSQNEGILFYWLEVCYEQMHKLQMKRLLNYDIEFQDGQVVASAIARYVGPIRELDEMKIQVVSEQDYEHNADKLIQALKKIGLQTHMKKDDIFNANQRQNILFNLQLLHALPHYIPKAQPIIFTCVLGEEVIKNIELTNPTNKPIAYWVQREGANEFQIESDESFVIEAKQTYKVKVKFTSRVSDTVYGKITFTNKKESNISAAALVFELQSQITGRISVKLWPMHTGLYDRVMQDIIIQNPYTNADMAEFQITIVCEKYKLLADDNKKKIPKKKKGSQEKIEEVFPAFFCLKETIKIRKNQSQPLNIIFLPLVMEDQRCFVIFKDKNVGEFQHEIIGKVDEPKSPLDNIRFPTGNNIIYVDEPTTVEFPISLNNEQITKARNDITSFTLEKHRDKIRAQQKNMLPGSSQPEKLIFPGQNLDQIVFDVELQPPTSFIQVPPSFTLTNFRANTKKSDRDKDKKDDKKGKKDKPNESFVDKDPIQPIQEIQNTNKFPINLSFKNPYNGKLLLTLRNSQKTDIRKYQIAIVAHPKPVKATLEFRIPARNIATQDIPIINNTDRDWPIKVALTQDYKKNGHMFYSDIKQSKEFIVKKKSTDYFHLHFAPKMQCICESRLELSNPITNDKFEYELKGFGEEPVAEDHIVINCKARESTLYDIELKNPYNERDVTYQVETDLINSAGPSTFTIKAGKTSKYPLKVSPVLSGQYTGSITFQESQDVYIWYTVLLNTESPRATDCIELSTQIRQAVAFEIELQNPLKEASTFDVIINGEGLIGESQFTVAAESTNVYELVFSPLFTGRSAGSIAFINESLGEIWYELKLISEEQIPQRLPVLKTELGKVESHTIYLENPTDKEAKVQTKIINQTNFDVLPENIVLKPYEQNKIQIRYMPSNLDITENGEIIFSTQELGKWRYLVFGLGIPPTKFGERVVSVGLNKDFSSTIHFKNPFKEAINVTVTMEADGENQEVFKLLTKSKKNENKTTLSVPGMNIIQIPYSFVPREINCYYCEVVVQMNEKIEWRYPIKGVTESIQNQTFHHFKTQCRKKLDKDIQIFLPGIVQINNQRDEFTYELEIPPEFENVVKSSFKVKAIKKSLDFGTDPLEYQIQFEPLKPFKTSIDFNVLRQTGGRWKFRMILEATAPNEDDQIIISSPLNRTSSVSFKLTNHKKQYSHFTAQFTPDSDPEFTIMPKSGKLERLGTEGTTFIISFTPIEYGKMRRGKLIIQTDELFWSYSVKGVLPKYNPPLAMESLIDDKHNKQISMVLNQKPHPRNFLIDNIRKSKQSSPKKLLNSESQQMNQESKVFGVDKSQSFISKR